MTKPTHKLTLQVLMDYIKKKHGTPKKEIAKWLGIKDDFDVPVYKETKKRARK